MTYLEIDGLELQIAFKSIKELCLVTSIPMAIGREVCGPLGCHFFSEHY
jgi:hypothetical protein